jgi:tRNA(Arg) A34 adenosine deaminase TadA
MDYMKLAIMQAKEAIKHNEVPVGALIVDSTSGKILASAYNLCESLSDPTAHAEMLVIKKACSLLGSSKLTFCDLYVTLEPCLMCAAAISFAKIRKLYFAAYDKKSWGMTQGAEIFFHHFAHHVPEIYGGIQEKAAQELLEDFFRDKRDSPIGNN